MKPKIWPVLTRCIEEGATYGVNRAFKHTDNPSRDKIVEEVDNAIMNEICEYFDLEDNVTPVGD